MSSNNNIDTLLTHLRNIIDDLATRLPLKGLRDRLPSISMPKFNWPPLIIGDLTVKVPIVQGGMGVAVSLSGLATAVAEAGGIGVIAANGIGMLEKDYFKDGRAANLRAFQREIRTARQATRGAIGVNIMVAVNDFHQLVEVAIDERVDIIFMGAGLPIKDLPVERMQAAGVKAMPIISSARAATMIYRMWKKIYNTVPDGVVFEGPKAGGHLGFSAEQLDDPDFQLETIVPQIKEALEPFEAEFDRKFPVIAGGGVFTGEDIHRVLNLGAAAVQMGTRFVATDECDADIAFKQAYVDCTEEEIGLIKSPVGMPGRAIRNEFINSAENGTLPSFKCAWQCLASCKADAANYCISIALNNARRGMTKRGFVFAGTNAYRVSEIVPVSVLVGELATGYRAAAREAVTSRLEGTIQQLETLRQQYDGLVATVRSLGQRQAATRIVHIGRMGAANLKRQYFSLQQRLQSVRSQLTEGIKDSLNIIDRHLGQI